MTSARVGDTGLILRVPEVEPAVDRWRERYDSMASLGVPAHITVLYPWIPTGLLTDDDHLAVADIAAGTDPIDVTFAAVGRFPDVLWLDPQPRRPILALIAVVSARWPDYPPYGGRYGDAPVPHLTVADVDTDELDTDTDTDAAEPDRLRGPDRLAPVVADLERALPISATISELTLVVRQADGWSLDRSFPFRR